MISYLETTYLQHSRSHFLRQTRRQTQRNPFHSESCKYHSTTRSLECIHFSSDFGTLSAHAMSHRSLIKTMTEVLTKLLPLASFNQIRHTSAGIQDDTEPSSVNETSFFGSAKAFAAVGLSAPASRRHSTISQQNIITIMYFVSGFCHCYCHRRRRTTDISPNCLFLISSS